MTDHNVYQLARLADCGDPDSETSPGAEWLELVESCVSEIDTENPERGIHENAESLSDDSDGTHNRWQVFVDLCAYREDVSELGYEGSDMEEAAGLALYMIAERLLTALLEKREVAE